MKFSIVTLLISFCLVIPININAQETAMNVKKITRSELSDQIRDYVIKEMKRRKIVGLSIAVIDSMGSLLSDGFGFADRKKGIPADSTTLFPIASITKTFTGIAIMQLVENGLIDLDKPIGDYLDALHLPGGEEKIITTRMLLTHHSGIQGDILNNWYLPEVSHDPLIYEQVLDLINNAGTVFPPGKLHSYCNAGYTLLGVLIHKVSGISYVDYIRSHILSPLHMDNTIVYAGENTDKIIAMGYNGKIQTPMPMKLGIPAGGIALSSEDAAKFMQAVMKTYHGEEILTKPETMRQMMTRQNGNVPIDQGFSMGLSWFLQDRLHEYTRYASHRGELPPYHAMLIILPELKTGVFISVNTNKAASAPDDMAHKIIYDLYTLYTGNTVEPDKKNKPIRPDYQEIVQYEGFYPNVYFGPMKISAHKNKLILKSSALPLPLDLLPQEDARYAIKMKLLGCIPLPIAMLDAMYVEFRNIENDKYLIFNITNNLINPNIRIKPYTIPNEYSKYSGRYRVMNMKNSDRVVKDVIIKKHNEFSVLCYTFLGRHKFNLALRPIDDTTARIAGEGQFLGEKIQWKTGSGNIQMHWSGLVLEKH